LGLRLVIYLGLPAGAGLVLLSGPLARLLFEHGEFTADDASRVARMIACYGLGVGAYCALPVVVRGFYALGDLRTPVKAGLVAMLANLAMNLALLWPMAEAGLALSTSLAAALQLALLIALFARKFGALHWRELGSTLRTTLLATAALLAAGGTVLWLLPAGLQIGSEIAGVICPLIAGGAAFFLVSWWFRAPELAVIWRVRAS
jgi:putative peptidoglycan lipid II flippase